MSEELEDLIADESEEDEMPDLISPEELEQKLRDERKEMSKRALRHRAELWTRAYATDDAFKELVAEFRQRKARMNRHFSNGLLAGQSYDQREIDRQRGYLEGLGYLDTLLKAAQNLLDELDALDAKSEPENDNEDLGGWAGWPEN